MNNVEWCKENCSYYPDCYGAGVCNFVVSLLKEQEAVVRCKDCEMNNQCSIQFKFADPDDLGEWYCANGKRHEGS